MVNLFMVHLKMPKISSAYAVKHSYRNLSRYLLYNYLAEPYAHISSTHLQVIEDLALIFNTLIPHQILPRVEPPMEVHPRNPEQIKITSITPRINTPAPTLMLTHSVSIFIKSIPKGHICRKQSSPHLWYLHTTLSFQRPTFHIRLNPRQ